MSHSLFFDVFRFLFQFNFQLCQMLFQKWRSKSTMELLNSQVKLYIMVFIAVLLYTTFQTFSCCDSVLSPALHHTSHYFCQDTEYFNCQRLTFTDTTPHDATPCYIILVGCHMRAVMFEIILSLRSSCDRTGCCSCIPLFFSISTF